MVNRDVPLSINHLPLTIYHSLFTMNELVYAADLGGTNLRMAAVDNSGGIRHLTKRPVPHGVSPEELMALIGDMAGECRGQMEKRDFSAVAFTAPSPVAKDFDGVLTKLPNLPTITGMNLKEELHKLFGLPVFIENDATAAGIGEHWIGATRGVENSICVTLGTGIGGGIIINNEPLRGKDGTGGEIGHICVEPDGRPCGCGSHGCVEQYASATAIARMAVEAGMNATSAAEVYEAWTAGDKHAKAVFNTMGRYLGIMLAGLSNALNPETIVVCGGVTAGWDAFAGRVESEIATRAYPVVAARAKLVRGTLGDNAGILGAARSAFLAAQN